MRTLRSPFIQGRPLLCGPQINRAANIRNRILRLGHAAIRIARKDIETTEKEITMETTKIKPFTDVERKCIANNCKHFICWEYWGCELHSCKLIGQSETIEKPANHNECFANDK